jgi:hypothetical protein
MVATVADVLSELIVEVEGTNCSVCPRVDCQATLQSRSARIST